MVQNRAVLGSAESLRLRRQGLIARALSALSVPAAVRLPADVEENVLGTVTAPMLGIEPEPGEGEEAVEGEEAAAEGEEAAQGEAAPGESAEPGATEE